MLNQTITTLLSFSKGHCEETEKAYGDKRDFIDGAAWRRSVHRLNARYCPNKRSLSRSSVIPETPRRSMRACRRYESSLTLEVDNVIETHISCLNYARWVAKQL